MKVNSIEIGTNIGVNTDIVEPQVLNFRSKHAVPNKGTGHDEFVYAKKNNSQDSIIKALRIIGGLALIGAGVFVLHKTSKKPAKDILTSSEFKTVNDAKEYFEKLGINTEFHDISDKHLALLGRIKNNIESLKTNGVKINKPDSITISDWTKASEYEELCRKRGISTERKENFHAFCAGVKEGKSHIFINSNHPEFDKFLHEMGHASHQIGKDSYWHSKGFIEHDFADNQLGILGVKDKVYRSGHVHGSNLSNILSLHEKNSPSQFIFPNTEREARFVNARGIIDKMYSETDCYDGGKLLMEEVADVFEGLMKGKKFSDEVMLYYDFAGGARIPNLKIEGKPYDEYIESLYNNPELIEKLKQNVKISKI